MESDNETVDEVLRCMQNDIVHFIGKPVKHSRDLLQEYHDRFKAAHKREKDVLMRNLNALEKAVEETCGKDLIERIAARKKEIQNGRQ